MLRKERGLPQKKAAEHFGISQALLSHYEKGIRECGLDFVVMAADYYNVSVDFLLGRSPERNGSVINVNDIPDNVMQTDNRGMRSNSNVLLTLNNRLIASSISVIFAMLQEINNKELSAEVSNYLSMSIYKMFRRVYSYSDNAPQNIFAIDEDVYSDKVLCEQIMTESKIKEITAEASDKKNYTLNSEELSKRYPQLYVALSNLIHNCETKLGARRIK